ICYLSSERTIQIIFIIQVQSGCDANAQQKLETCSQELVTIGVLDSRSSNPLQQIAFGAQHLSSQHSNEFILKICAAYDRFNQCVDSGSSVKHFCYALHPLKIRYGITDAALNYICGQGYKCALLLKATPPSIR
ncbi:unnamed protein product, partial [Anisakis simplex]|uniref:PMEI domain-containing protein n=1 Tax=Anisakis simplex TaxID=6269 RepID=A0A0M3J4D9_ANISI